MSTPHDDAQLLEHVKADFRNMLYVVWRHLGLPEPDAVQYDIAEYLQHGPKRCIIEAFRGVGKSWITAAFVLWLLLCDPHLKIMVVSAGEDRAIAFSNFVKQLIHDMPMLSHLKARKDQRDSVESFDVGPARPSQSPSVKSVGITGQLTGSRADVIIADDIETPKNSQTSKMRERIAELVKEFDAVLTTREDTRIIYLGTPQCEASLYNKLPQRGYSMRIWPAEVPDRPKLGNYRGRLAPFVLDKVNTDVKPGTCIEPRRFGTVELLERKASWGRSGYALQYMLDTSLSDADRYPLKMSDLMVIDIGDMVPVEMVWGGSHEQAIDDLPCVGLDGDRLHQPAFTSKDFAKFTGTVMFIDPSGKGSDETAWAVVSVLGTRLFLRHVAGSREGFSKATLARIAADCKRFSVNVVRSEPNFGGGMFTELLKAELRNVHPCRVEDAEWSRGQKEARMLDILEPLVQAHRLVIDRRVLSEDARSDVVEYQFGHQFTRITRDRGALAHDDRLEAVAGGCFEWIHAMAKDDKSAAADHREELLDAELQKFMEHALGGKTGREGWLKSYDL